MDERIENEVPPFNFVYYCSKSMNLNNITKDNGKRRFALYRFPVVPPGKNAMDLAAPHSLPM